MPERLLTLPWKFTGEGGDLSSREGVGSAELTAGVKNIVVFNNVCRTVAVVLVIMLSSCDRAEKPPVTSAKPPVSPAVKAAPVSAGCFSLRWPSAAPFRNYAKVGFRPRLPRTFELTRERDPDGDYRIRTFNATDYSFSSGWSIEPSGIEMGWSTGFIGIGVTIPSLPETTEIKGIARTFSDAGEPSETVKVKVVRIPCR